MSAGFWFLFITVCVIGSAIGIAEWVVERKQGKRKSSKGFWWGLLAFCALFDCFNDKRK